MISSDTSLASFDADLGTGEIAQQWLSPPETILRPDWQKIPRFKEAQQAATMFDVETDDPCWMQDISSIPDYAPEKQVLLLRPEWHQESLLYYQAEATYFPPWLTETFSRLHEVGQLAEDWDGYGSPGTNAEVLEAAEAMLQSLNAQPRNLLPAAFVCPIAGGTLQFEWTLGHRHLEIEFTDHKHLAVLTEDSSSGRPIMQTDEFPATRIDLIRPLLDWLVAS